MSPVRFPFHISPAASGCPCRTARTAGPRAGTGSTSLRASVATDRLRLAVARPGAPGILGNIGEVRIWAGNHGLLRRLNPITVSGEADERFPASALIDGDTDTPWALPAGQESGACAVSLDPRARVGLVRISAKTPGASITLAREIGPNLLQQTPLQPGWNTFALDLAGGLFTLKLEGATRLQELEFWGEGPADDPAPLLLPLETSLTAGAACASFFQLSPAGLAGAELTIAGRGDLTSLQVRVNGTLLANPVPLGEGAQRYRIPAAILSPAGNTLAIQAGGAARIDYVLIAGEPHPGAIRPQAPSALIDGDLATSLGKEGGSYDLTLGGRHALLETAVYADGPAVISIEARNGGAWTTIPGLDRVAVGNAGVGWYTFSAAVTADGLRLIIHGPGAGIAELAVTGSPSNDGPPVLRLLGPAPGDIVGQTVTVVGMVDDPDAEITVNGVTATLNGHLFTATITLSATSADAARQISLTAVDPAGQETQATVTVYLTAAPPRHHALRSPGRRRHRGRHGGSLRPSGRRRL